MKEGLALVADVGGTHVRIALASSDGMPTLDMSTARQLRVAEFPSFLAAAQHYLRENNLEIGSIRNAVLAVAGRVVEGRAQVTNHGWLISASETREALGLEALHLVNDFEAQAFATTCLDPAHVVHINHAGAIPPPSADRTYAVIGPGTGLGISALLIRDGRTLVLETEGGHASFAASTSEQFAVRQILAESFGSVSYERFLSGGGLCNIVEALSRLRGRSAPPGMKPEDVSNGARQGDPLCRQALEMFFSVFGALAGDQVLALGAWDGVFLSGGLVPKLLPELLASDFMPRFSDKGRFRGAVACVPVAAVVHPQPGLLGAAVIASATRAG